MKKSLYFVLIYNPGQKNLHRILQMRKFNLLFWRGYAHFNGNRPKLSLQKKRKFPLRISLVNVTKSAVSPAFTETVHSHNFFTPGNQVKLRYFTQCYKSVLAFPPPELNVVYPCFWGFPGAPHYSQTFSSTWNMGEGRNMWKNLCPRL